MGLRVNSTLPSMRRGKDELRGAYLARVTLFVMGVVALSIGVAILKGSIANVSQKLGLGLVVGGGVLIAATASVRVRKEIASKAEPTPKKEVYEAENTTTGAIPVAEPVVEDEPPPYPGTADEPKCSAPPATLSSPTLEMAIPKHPAPKTSLPNLSQPPKSKNDMLFEIAQSYINERNFNAAITTLGQIIADFERKEKMIFEIAQSYINERNRDAAITTLKWIFSDFQRKDKMLFEIAQSYINERNFNAAIATLRWITSDFQRKDKMTSEIAQHYINEGNRAKAEKILRGY